VVARFFSLGIVAGLSFLASLGMSPMSGAHAAGPLWSGHATQGKRPLFRPWQRVVRRTPNPRWRPPATGLVQRRTTVVTGTSAAAGSRVHPARPAVFSGTSVAPRKPGSAARPAFPGARFRPTQRAVSALNPVGATAVQRAAWQQAQVQSQFRPARRQRKASYEEMRAAGTPDSFIATRTMGYPLSHRMPIGPYGMHWQTW
jgi:hypothetical protein